MVRRRDTQFLLANLNGAYLNGAYLNGANLNGAYLNGANLNGASLNGAYLNGDDSYMKCFKSEFLKKIYSYTYNYYKNPQITSASNRRATIYGNNCENELVVSLLCTPTHTPTHTHRYQTMQPIHYRIATPLQSDLTSQG